jgi:hypothetical protein
MRLPFSEPDPAGTERARIAKRQRDLATEISRTQAQARTRANGEESDHGHPLQVVQMIRHGSAVSRCWL